MDQAKANFKKIVDWTDNLQKISAVLEIKSDDLNLEEYQKKFEEAMDDDLNTPLALSVLYELITETNKLIAQNSLNAEKAKKIQALWEKMNKVFGLVIPGEKEEIPENILALAEERKKARISKDFSKADEIRKKIEKAGYILEDLKNNEYSIKK